MAGFLWLVSMLTIFVFDPLSTGPGGPFCPALCSADGPSTPFATPYLDVVDTVRVVVVVLALCCVIATPQVMYNAYSQGQRMRFFGICLFIITAATTEMAHFGDYPSYRLVLNLVGTVATTYGVLQFLREARQYRKSRESRAQL